MDKSHELRRKPSVRSREKQNGFLVKLFQSRCKSQGVDLLSTPCISGTKIRILDDQSTEKTWLDEALGSYPNTLTTEVSFLAFTFIPTTNASINAATEMAAAARYAMV